MGKVTRRSWLPEAMAFIRELMKMAKNSVEGGGSSYFDFNALIEDLRSQAIAGEATEDGKKEKKRMLEGI